tara:strand:- start:4845 stop:5531 length:687 start_codon:yes stop_codon:yes gene_type:complete
MNAPTMKWGILLSLAICLVSDTSLSAQITGQPVSILTHATIHLEGGQSVRMVMTSKEQKYIRASIRNQKKTTLADIIYDGKAIAIVVMESPQKRSLVLSGEEAATNLFDLIAINPEYHFKNIDGFNLNIPTFKAYRVELQTEAEPVEETERHRPVKALLYKEHDAGSTLVRSIEYMEFFDQADPYFQPKKISFTDVKTGDIGHITVDKIEYNIGLPSFLFEIRGNTDK